MCSNMHELPGIGRARGSMRKFSRPVSGAVALAVGLASCSCLSYTFVPDAGVSRGLSAIRRDSSKQEMPSRLRNAACIRLKAEIQKYKSDEIRIGILVGCTSAEPNWLSDPANQKVMDGLSLAEACEGISGCWKPGPMAAPDTRDFTLPAQVTIHAALVKKALELHGGNRVVWEERVDRVLQLPITSKLKAMKEPVDAIVVIYRLGYDNANLIAKYSCVINGLQSVALRLGVPIVSHNLAEIKLSVANLESAIKRVGERVVKMGKMADPVVVEYEEAH